MKRTISGAWGVLSACDASTCAKTQNVRNIRNIRIHEENNQSIHIVTRENLFRLCRNTPERAGTNLFRHVPAMFRLGLFTGTGYSLSATGLADDQSKIVFRHVPVAPEHFQKTGSPKRRGLQPCAPVRVPDVPDVTTPCARFLFMPLPSSSPRCLPWPS